MLIMKNLRFKIHRSLWKLKVIIQEFFRRIKYKAQLKNTYLLCQDKYKNGERCFIVGNGPSLRIEDLERLSDNGEITFAANRIYKLFPSTTWRPTYYGVCDTTLFKKSQNEIDAVDSFKFLPLDIYDAYTVNKDNYHVFSRIPFTFFNLKPSFGSSFKGLFGEGGTITYHLIQIAVAMGFKEIYLIGMDFSFSFGIGADGKYFEDKSIKSNHFGADNSKLDVAPNLYSNLRAYSVAKKYADNHGISIYNATRGGKLEVFPRINIDEIFEKEEIKK